MFADDVRDEAKYECSDYARNVHVALFLQELSHESSPFS